MEKIIDEILKNHELIAVAMPLLALVADAIIGAVPDRYIRYIGIIRRIAVWLSARGGGRAG